MVQKGCPFADSVGIARKLWKTNRAIDRPDATISAVPVPPGDALTLCFVNESSQTSGLPAESILVQEELIRNVTLVAPVLENFVIGEALLHQI
jgi:hypothetical protein